MEHNFENLATVLNRCSAQVADQVIAEIRIAIHEATNGSLTPESRLSKMAMRVRKTRTERAAERRAKAAERRAAKKAAKQAEMAPVSCESCGEAAAELQRVASPAEAKNHFSEKMVKYLRQCPAQQMLSVLNSYTHLLLTGSLVHTDSDHRYVDNFIYLARLEGLIVTELEPTIEEASTFLFDNPASPLPRAERRRLQRLARKHKL